MAARWKAKPQGFTTVRKDGWWVRPGDASARPAGTPAAAPRSAAVNRLVPREWQGSQGVLGGYAKEPRLDPNRYEWTQNPENNRWFARPRTELTGLDPQMRADVASFDQQGNDQSARIQSSFDQFVKEAEANRAATTAGLTGLAGAVGAGYMASDPTAAALQGTTRATAQASALPVAARLSDAPLVARSEGVSRLQDFLGQRREQRAGLISDYRGQQSEAAAAQAETAAELRGQNLEHLGKVLAGKVDLEEAGIRAETATTVATTRAQTAENARKTKLYTDLERIRQQDTNNRRSTAAQLRGQNMQYLKSVLGSETANNDRAAKLVTAALTIRQRADAARAQGKTSRANALDKLALQRELAAKKANGPAMTPKDRQKRQRDNAKALGLAQQLKRGTLNDDGTRTIYTFEEIVSNLTGNFDLTPKEAEKIARRAGAAPAVESVGSWFQGFPGGR